MNGMDVFERNTEAPHPLTGNSLRKRGVDPLPRRRFGRSALARIYLCWRSAYRVHGFVSYQSNQFVQVLILNVSEIGCTEYCGNRTLYNPHHSSSSKDLRESFNTLWGNGGNVTGEQHDDTVTIAGLTALDQTFGKANTFSAYTVYSELPVDGMFGLGFRSISMFAFKLADNSPGSVVRTEMTLTISNPEQTVTRAKAQG